MNKYVWFAMVALCVLGALFRALRPRRPVRPLGDADRQQIQALVASNQHIPAMRLYRQATGASLKEAKQAIEGFRAGG